MKIAFFDSGIGGLSVLYEALRLLPDEEYLYYADTNHVPYGRKPQDEILRYVEQSAAFLLNQGAQAVVVACNTATAVAINVLRDRYDIPIVGMEPAVKPAVERTLDTAERILLLATPVTIEESKLKDLLQRVDGQHRVDLLALPELVEFAEKEAFDTPDVRVYLQDVFSRYDMAQYHTLVLGCTHFTYFRPLFQELLGAQTALIDGNAGTVRRLADVAALKTADAGHRVSDIGKLPVTFFVSGRDVTGTQEEARFYRVLRHLETISTGL